MRAWLVSLLFLTSLQSQIPPGGFHAQRLPASFFAGNRARLLEHLKAMGPGTLAVVKSMPEVPRNGGIDYAYRQDSDFYYLTGVEEGGSVALLEAEGPKPYTLLVRARNPRKEAYDGPSLGVEGAKGLGASDAVEFPKAEETLEQAIRKAERVVLICNFDDPFRKKILDWVYPLGANNGHSRFKKILVDGRNLLGEMRVIKQPLEIEMLQKAVEVSIEGHLAAMRASAFAANEGQVAGAFEGTVRSLGARYLGYDTIAGDGNNSCVLHYPFNDQPMQNGAVFLMDAGAEVGFYTADITRTWPPAGRFSPEQRSLYDLVLKAQNAAIEVCRPGHKHHEGMDAAMRILSDGLVDLGILKGDKAGVFEKGDWRRFTLHGISHWLGLDVHDAGNYDFQKEKHRGQRTLEPGMILTVEPGVYIPKGAEGVDPKWHGIGIRIEDDILVTSQHPRNLSDRLPRTPEELEGVIQKVLRGRRK